MKRHAETLDERAGDPAPGTHAGDPVPGVLLLFSSGRALSQAIALGISPLEIGREQPPFDELHDPQLSRRHASLWFADGRFFVRDLGSRNGTAIDGQHLEKEWRGGAGHVVRAGRTLLLLTNDVRRFGRGVEMNDGVVMGPALHEAWAALARAARAAATLLLHGESGSGKELAARAFHQLGPQPRGPFVAVNCAAIPESVAERLLFGARKGAYSGAAADAEGYVQAAHGGTLFLDEVGELDARVQAKLLRVVEQREVLPLGAAHPVPVDIRICSASHRDLRAEVAAGRLREDLYFRLGRPLVSLPPLRDRREEIPWLIEHLLGQQSPARPAHVSLVESCLLRRWPGNLRELTSEIRAAAQTAHAEGAEEVRGQHLARDAGHSLLAPPESDAADASAQLDAAKGAADAPRPARAGAPGKEELVALMERHGGVIKDVAHELDCSRRQVGRWLDQYAIDRSRFRA